MMRDLVVCSSQRTGSTLLCGLLRTTGLISGGLEYFERNFVMPNHVLPYMDLASVAEAESDIDGYLRRIRSYWQRRGRRLCVKIHWPDLVIWRDLGLDLEKHFPDAQFIHCRRRDRVSQAISKSRALQTKAWTGQQAEAREPTYAFEEIVRLMIQLQAHEDAWTDYFLAEKVDAIGVDYEDVAEDPRGAVKALATSLGWPVGRLRLLRARKTTSVQRDSLNASWKRQFFRDLNTRLPTFLAGP